MKFFTSIVMLHHVSDDPLYDAFKPYSISRKSFQNLLDFIASAEIETSTFRDTDPTSDIQCLGKRQIVLTFDDCPKHLLDFAVPELIKRNMKAVFFAPTAYIGKVNAWDVAQGQPAIDLMSGDELVDLQKAGMEIGSHAHHHIRLGQLKHTEELNFQLTESKRILEAILQQEVISFAYPYGSYPQNHASLLANAGYQFGCSIFSSKQDRFALRRFIYHDGDTRTKLRWKHSLFYHLYRSFRDSRKNAYV